MCFKKYETFPTLSIIGKLGVDLFSHKTVQDLDLHLPL